MKLEKVIGDCLRNNGWTLSISESCTGGLICDRITNVSGSSDYFMGGMVNYSNQSKSRHLGVPSNDIKKYGAVSPPVARKMAQGVRKAFGTTFGLSTTGVAGPTGGTKRSPIGKVFIGLTVGKKVWVKKLDLKGSRREIKKNATDKALQLFYELLVKTSITAHERGTPLRVYGRRNRIILEPVVRDLVEEGRGMLKTKGRILKSLIEGRKREAKQ